MRTLTPVKRKKKEVKMSKLKVGSSKKYLSILRQFINDAPSSGESKEMAVLALAQLQKITAGTDIVLTGTDFICTGKPRA
jgi:hypothetical protein